MGYCERCGGKYDFEGLCEGCGTDEEWSWNTPENKNKVICEGCGHEIYEVRRHCHVCGKINPAAFKTGSAYCPDCGNAFENGICPNCGRTLDFFKKREFAQTDLRYCTKCGAKTSRNDCFCIDCGNENYINEPSKNPVKITSKPAPKPVVLPNEKPKKYVSDDFDDDDEEYGKTKLNTTLWIILGVLSSLFCCLIGGIITTVFAVKADRFQKEGKFYPAATALEKAEGWFAFTMIIWVIEIIIGIIAAIIF